MTIYIVVRVNDAPYIAGSFASKQQAIEFRNAIAARHTHNTYEMFLSNLEA